MEALNKDAKLSLEVQGSLLRECGSTLSPEYIRQISYIEERRQVICGREEIMDND